LKCVSLTPAVFRLNADETECTQGLRLHDKRALQRLCNNCLHLPEQIFI